MLRKLFGLVAQTHYKATRQAAADFLKHMKKHFPFSTQSIQVDSGSEFCRHFETACQANQINMNAQQLFF